VRAPAGSVSGGIDVRIVAEELGGKSKRIESKARFIAPVGP